MKFVFPTRVIPSRICLGTGSFGSEISRRDSFAVLDAFIEAGGNFIDTAHIYAAWVKGAWGASERTIGEWLRAHGARDAVVLGTKGGHPPLDDMKRARCGKADVEQDLNESLERLGVDTIDVYWLHRDDPERPVGEIIEALAGLMRDGRIRCYAASNWTTARMDAGNVYSAEHYLPPLVANQSGWALADHETDHTSPSPMRYLDESMRLWHVQRNFPMVAYTSQAKGYFGESNAAWAKTGFNGPPPKGREFDTPANRRRLLKAINFAQQKGCTVNQIALAYLLHQPFPTFPIIGTSNPDRIRDVMAALHVSLDEAECAELRG